MTRALIIPAAGRGSRLQADVPKALYPLDGRPLLDRLIDRYRAHVDRFILVIRPADRAAFVQHAPLIAAPHDLVEQAEPTGMLDAILLARDTLAPHAPRRIWITWCDQVAISEATVRQLAALDEEKPAAALVMPTVRSAAPYVHLERDARGRIVRILHRREGDEMPEGGESDAGLFSLSHEAYFDLLPQYARSVGAGVGRGAGRGAERGAGTGERNFLPFIPWLAADREVRTFPCAAPMEAVGLNTPEDAARLAAHLRGSRVSVVIPAYNEAAFIGTLLERIAEVDLTPLGFTREIIVVDDCSTDETARIASSFPGVTLRRQPRNAGKGAAVRAGIEAASGDYVLIQDADLEYDPRDYLPMLAALKAGRGDIVYGSRYLKHPDKGALANLAAGRHPGQSWLAWLGGQSLSLVALACTGRYLTDTVTAFKLFRRDLLRDLRLETSGFELDHEITAKALARGQRIAEVPIRYYPRTKAEGKKIGMKDWFRGTRTFYRYRRG